MTPDAFKYGRMVGGGIAAAMGIAEAVGGLLAIGGGSIGGALTCIETLGAGCVVGGAVVAEGAYVTVAGAVTAVNGVMAVAQQASAVGTGSGPTKIIPKLSQGNNRQGLEHIVRNHWYSSGVPNKSRFGSNIGLRQLRDLINKSAGDTSLWTLDHGSWVRDLDTGAIIEGWINLWLITLPKWVGSEKA